MVLFTVHNSTPETVRFDLGLGGTRGFVLRIVRPDGTGVDAPRIPAGSGLFRTGRVTIAPFAQHTEELILNEWFAFGQPGSYRVGIELATSMTNESGAAIHARTSGVVTVQVGPRDERVLEEICGALSERIRGTSDIGSQFADARKLANVNDAVALPYIRQLLEHTDSVDHFLFRSLVRMGTPEAQTVLSEMAKSRDDGRASQAAAALDLAKKRR
jgi:hypothetical protein